MAGDMKTLHLAPGHWAGHMRIYHRICLSLVQAGHGVELAAHPSAIDHLDARVQLRSLGDMGRPTLDWRLAQRLQRSRRAFAVGMASEADVLAFYAPEFISWAARLRRARRRPVIFDCMEDFEGYALQRGGIPAWLRRPLARLVRAQLRYAARTLDAIVTSDAGTASLIGAHTRRVLVVHNFPRLALFPDPAAQPVEKQYDLTYHGSIPRYHLEVCFAVDDALLARGRHVSWRFLGRMAERAWFEREVARRGAQARFLFSESIPHDQVAAEVARARIGIIPLPDRPKFQHNLPQKLFEFMALRIPVVLSDLPPSRPFVGDGACARMVPHDSPAAYADAIAGLLDDEALRQRMGDEGRRRVETEYHWEREVRKLLALYDELGPNRASSATPRGAARA
jgi:glycosyltransferase involved in cell wall biosynthesis